MIELRAATEDEVVAALLRAEIASPRWSERFRIRLMRDRMPVHLLERPNLADATDNAYRRLLLGEVRGWGRGQLLFQGFPGEVCWSLVALAPEELAALRYIKWSYWLDLSGIATRRLPVDAATRIRAGLAEEHRVSYEQVAARVRAGEALPELIAVTGTGEGELIVVVEGHARLTGYLLAREALPAQTQIFLGRSPRITQWGLY